MRMNVYKNQFSQTSEYVCDVNFTLVNSPKKIETKALSKENKAELKYIS